MLQVGVLWSYNVKFILYMVVIGPQTPLLPLFVSTSKHIAFSYLSHFISDHTIIGWRSTTIPVAKPWDLGDESGRGARWLRRLAENQTKPNW